MKAKKLTKTQAELWNAIRHALPHGICKAAHVLWHEVQYREDGVTILAGCNLSATVEALAKAGYVEIVKLGGKGSDVVYAAAPLGERRVEVGPDETHPARVGSFVVCLFPDLPPWLGGPARRSFGMPADEAARVFEEAGWTVTRTAEAGR